MSWSLTGLPIGSSIPITVSSNDVGSVGLFSGGAGFYATPTGLYFNFANLDGGSGKLTYAEFESNRGSISFLDAADNAGEQYGAYYVCTSPAGFNCVNEHETTLIEIGSAVPLPASAWLLLSGICVLGRATLRSRPRRNAF
jgi:hypothetical protein